MRDTGVIASWDISPRPGARQQYGPAAGDCCTCYSALAPFGRRAADEALARYERQLRRPGSVGELR